MPSHGYDFHEHLPSKKLSKAAVEFESPAKGKNHCSSCKHFLAASEACEIVAGSILATDWCKRWIAK
jgi:hypothetical protein